MMMTKPLSQHDAPTAFAQRCYQLLKTVPQGKVITYKALAQALGTKAYRAVGTALNKNPYAPHVPCHRVVNADGRLGGFAEGERRKASLLRKEGVIIRNGRVDLGTYGYTLRK